MKQIAFALLLALLFYEAKSQLADNFTDGDFTNNPAWHGDDSLFRVTNGELRLTGTVASDAHLVLNNQLMDSTVWEFLCRFELSPSAQNFVRFYLVSDVANLESSLNGYYVQLGGVTGNTDSITLYKQVGLARTRLIGGRPATVSKNSNKVRIKVFRDADGNWELFSDTTGGKSFVLEGAAHDVSVNMCLYSGWVIKYTAGNNQRYYLDDVLINKFKIDDEAPLIDSVLVMNHHTLDVYFNEDVDSTTANTLLHYAVQPSIGNPLQIELLSSRVVRLMFQNPFQNHQPYVLNIHNVADVMGNVMALQQVTFRYDIPELYDVLISEFMPDPSPVVGLPEYEFIELYNNTNAPISLGGFTISDGTSAATLPSYVLMPDEFVVLCSNTASSSFVPYGHVLGLSTWPSLNNASDSIILKSNKGDVIHALYYDASWYQDAAKDDGGYSIELNNPFQLCKGKMVYAASSHNLGGTPGTTNATWIKQADTSAPQLLSATALDSITITLLFDESIYTDILQVSNIKIEPSVDVQTFSMVNTTTLQLKLISPLSNNTSYRIQIANVKDCSGNSGLSATSLHYFMPEQAQTYDVLIHEIMANPNPPQQLPNAEYVELYNRSNKRISLKGWTLGDETSTAKLQDYVLLPDSFIVITSSSNKTLFNIDVMGVSSFPSLGNDGDHLVLKNADGKIIHAITYTSAWYYDGFKKQGGFSLEMIDAANPCGLNNWKATTNKQGGTPGHQNAVKGNNKDKTSPRLLRAYAFDSLHVQLFLSESMDSTSFKPQHFWLNNSGNVLEVNGQANHYNSTILTLNSPLLAQQGYTIQVDSLKDCAQNYIDDYNTTDVILGKPADSGDLIINEILFNARSGAYDFVELYNTSAFAVDLKNLLIAKRDDDGLISDIKTIAPLGFTIPAQAYAVITNDVNNLQQQYYCKYPEYILPVTLPSYTDKEGKVVLLNTAGVIYDEMHYHENMHFSLLDDKDGVSLERIDALRETNDVSNWTSAASAAGYATPTYSNSQNLTAHFDDQTLQLQPKRVSPDGDGFEDIMNINYQFEENGLTGTLMIFDVKGRVIKTLFKNHVLGTQGTYTWDGTTDVGNKADVGIYMFKLEVFNLTGKVKQYLAIGVVATKL